MRTRKDSLRNPEGSHGKGIKGRAKLLTAPRLALLGVAGIAAIVIWSPAFAIPFLHVAGDGDGDHVVDGSDGDPAVYCGTSHADVNSSGPTVDAVDVGLVRLAFLQEPPVNPLVDQNHNDAGDWLDQIIEVDYFTHSIAVDCTSAVPDPIPPTGIGATAGAVLNLTAMSGPGGNINPSVFTSGVTDAHRGYYAMLHFDETVVQAVSATNVMPGVSCLTPIIDNSDDAAGPDGYIILGCRISTSGYIGTLATFNFDVIAAGDPAFCIRPFTAMSGGPLRGTFTIGTDIAAQIQTLAGACGQAGPAFDSDGDGCSNEEEGGGVPTLGGERNSLFPYDFYDVNGSQNVNATDINMVRANWNPGGPVPPEDEIFDRSVGVATWAPGAPDGVINAVDVGLVRTSFNHSCTAAP